MSKKKIRVYVLQDSEGFFDAGARPFGRPICTVERSEAFEYTEEEVNEEFPDGLPEGWKKVLVSEFESKPPKGK